MIPNWVQKHILPEPNSGCWLWTGTVTSLGYGRLCIGQKREVYAHRYVYECVRGPISKNLNIDHLCRLPCCVNPDHLEPVTQKENVLRGIGPGALNAKKTHCKYGHEFTPENTKIRKASRGRYTFRDCRTCIKIRNDARFK